MRQRKSSDSISSDDYELLMATVVEEPARFKKLEDVHLYDKLPDALVKTQTVKVRELLDHIADIPDKKKQPERDQAVAALHTAADQETHALLGVLNHEINVVQRYSISESETTRKIEQKI